MKSTPQDKTAQTEAETFKQLTLFIQKAEKLGKYPSGTAAGFRSAMDAFQTAWTADEPETLEYLSKNAEEILTRQVETRELSANTFSTYLQRVRRVMDDWQRYGKNPKALLDWTPKRVTRRPSYGTNARNDFRLLTWSLRPGLTIQLQLPTDFGPDDYQRMLKLLQLELELHATPQ